MSKNILFGNAEITGNLNIDGDLVVSGNIVDLDVEKITAKDPVIGLNTPSLIAGYDTGLVMEKNFNDLINPIGATISAATLTTFTILGAQVAFIGYVVAVGAQKRKITGVAAIVGGYIYTVANWSPIPTTPVACNLYGETNSLFVYKPSTDSFYLGTTNLDNSNNVFPTIVAKPLYVSNIIQQNGEQIIYVSKEGNDSNDGLTISQAKLTFQGALDAGSYNIVCLDSGDYSAENIDTKISIFAPNATIGNVNIVSNCRVNFYKVADMKITAAAYVYIELGNEIYTESDLYIEAREIKILTVRGGTTRGKISRILSGPAIDIDNGFAHLISDYIDTTLSNTNTNGQLNILAAKIEDPSTSGTGNQYWADAPRIQNHILNTSNPHNTTWVQVSPLTTKGDIAVFNTRLPVGSNGQILSANSALPLGLEWVSNSSASNVIFCIAGGSYETFTNVYKTIGYFTWINSLYQNLSSGFLTFNIQGTGDVKFGTFATFSGSSGYYSIPFTKPVVDTIIELEIKSTTSLVITNVNLQFGALTPNDSYEYTNLNTGTYTLATTYEYVFCNSASGPITLNLPAATKKKYTIVDMGSAAINPITINGAVNSPFVISANFAQKNIVSDTVNWYIQN